MGSARSMMDKVGDEGLVVDGRKIFFEYSSKPTGENGGLLFGSDGPSKSGPMNYKSTTLLFDWMYTICGCISFAWRTSCFQCSEARTDDAPPADMTSSNSASFGKKGETGPAHVLVVRGLDENAGEEMLRSARSMAGSATPPNRSFLWTTRRGPASAMVGDNDSSSEDESSVQTPKPATQPKPIPRSAGYGAFLATSLNLPSHTKGLMQVYVGRKLLQEGGGSGTVVGQWLGWMMAAIYMGGRIPQIVLNIKRCSVEIWFISNGSNKNLAKRGTGQMDRVGYTSLKSRK